MPAITVTWGELFDRIACLEVKLEKLDDAASRATLEADLEILRDVAQAGAPGAVHALAGELAEVVRVLRDLDVRIGAYEKDASFGSRYVELSRSIREQERRRLDLRAGIDDLMADRRNKEEGRSV